MLQIKAPVVTITFLSVLSFNLVAALHVCSLRHCALYALSTLPHTARPALYAAVTERMQREVGRRFESFIDDMLHGDGDRERPRRRAEHRRAVEDAHAHEWHL